MTIMLRVFRKRPHFAKKADKGGGAVGIRLFHHNTEAYEAANAMLKEKGKAAVIHPTGTGKSFIGFKLCEDNPDKTICWLSPSEYIFKTQLENLAAVSDGWTPENLKFFTYARLSFLTDEEIDDIQPDYIVLDEFHRAGSEIWGGFTLKLLNKYPRVPILGLSATNIRYLDNQRDMAEELFDGNIASRMTLGEAIVRGILNPPKYVLSIYSYQEELEKFDTRVKNTKNSAAKKEAEQYLEALRRALEKADGIDEILAKNMDEKNGKYIVFCANYEHMQDIIGTKIHDWFHLVDERPKVYTLYSGEVGADESFRDFKEDTDNSHLRLLFCIDALNEGVHVEDISGVILLRPTVSPIIYKQQIGRALSASGIKMPVIFDIVNNIENLDSIDAVKSEMQIAVQYFRSSGESSAVVNERFEIIDKVVECRELFSLTEQIKLQLSSVKCLKQLASVGTESIKTVGRICIAK